MPPELEELPLFPLHTVLFPYGTLQLHVFEERYREMVRFCTEFERPFGVVLIKSGHEVGGPAEPHLVGTAVRVSQVHTFDDGSMDVRVVGERRFRVRRLDETARPFLLGFVEPVVEMDAESPMMEALAIRAKECFRLLVEGAIGRADMSVQIQFPPDPTALSFVIAHFLKIENREKQSLLESTDTGERLANLIPLIERQIVESRVSPGVEKLTAGHLEEWVFPN